MSQTATQSNRPKLTLAACCGVHGLQDGLSATLYVLLPVFVQVFGLSYVQVGVIRAVNNAAMTLFEIPSGILSERLGERVLLAFGLLSAGLGFVLMPASDGFWGLGFCLFAVGMGAAFQHALSSAIISRSYRQAGRRAALGVYNSSGDAGKLALAALASLVIGIGVSWQGVVYGFGIAAVLAAAALFAALSWVKAGGPPATSASSISSFRAWTEWGIRDRRGFSVLGLIVFLMSLVQGSFLTFVAFVMIDKQVPTGLASAAVVLTLTGGMIGKFACGFLAERFGVVRSLILVESATAFGIVAVVMSPTLLSFCLLPVVGLVLQGGSSITYATVGDLVDSKKQSRGFALIYSVSSAAAIAGPICFGLLGDRHGLAPAMLVMAATILASLPLCGLLRPSLVHKPA